MTLPRPLGSSLLSKAKHLIIFYLPTKFGDCSFSRPEDIIVGVEIKTMGYMTLTTPLWWWSVIFRLRYDIVYLCTKFSCFRDIVGAPEF